MKKLFFLLVVFTAFYPATYSSKNPNVVASMLGVPGLYPEGSTRYLNYYDVEGLSRWDLKIMRNEIYARHGYIFQTVEMSNYFNRCPWYYPRYNNVDRFLTTLEKRNIKFIKQYE